MKIGNKFFEIGKNTYIIGILNVTPDSFSDGGRHNGLNAAVARAKQMAADGADIIEIGGESTRPGYTPVSADEELARIIPVIEALKNQIDLPLAVDTQKPEAANTAILAGAVMVNDVSFFDHGPQMAEICAKHGVVCCASHNRADSVYTDLINETAADLKNYADVLLRVGVKAENIILDPGIGFAKSMDDNFEIMRHLEVFKKIGYPLMLGASRKRFLDYGGQIQGLPIQRNSGPAQRLEATLASAVIGVAKGCDFVRVHDVKENKRACLIADRVYRD